MKFIAAALAGSVSAIRLSAMVPELPDGVSMDDLWQAATGGKGELTGDDAWDAAKAIVGQLGLTLDDGDKQWLQEGFDYYAGDDGVMQADEAEAAVEALIEALEASDDELAQEGDAKPDGPGPKDGDDDGEVELDDDGADMEDLWGLVTGGDDLLDKDEAKEVVKGLANLLDWEIDEDDWAELGDIFDEIAGDDGVIDGGEALDAIEDLLEVDDDDCPIMSGLEDAWDQATGGDGLLDKDEAKAAAKAIAEEFGLEIDDDTMAELEEAFDEVAGDDGVIDGDEALGVLEDLVAEDSEEDDDE